MIYTYHAPAKINIGLDVLKKRSDGYHELDMIMQTIGLHDTLTFEVSSGNRLEMSCSNESLPTDKNNLVMKAASMLIEEFGIQSDIHIKLEKNIPVAAGMAGGSSDAATVFIALNDIFSLGLSKEDLMKRGVKLGADIPYCIMKGSARSRGIGDILTPLDAFDKVCVLIVKPDIEVSTGFVYGNLRIDDNTVHPDIAALILAMKERKLKTLGSLTGNVLESVTIPAHPVIADIKDVMTANGASASLMSGSGPTVFGLFENKEEATKAHKACMDRFPGSFSCVTYTISE